MADHKSTEEVENMVETLAAGFEALLEKARSLIRHQVKLERQLKSLREEISSQSLGGSVELTFDKDGNMAEISREEYDRKEAMRLEEELFSTSDVQAALDVTKKMAEVRDQKPNRPRPRCPVTHRSTDQEDFVHDFTTRGVQGNLGCPFAKMTQNGVAVSKDPIAAEFHHSATSVPAAPDAAAGKCPIRFLDQHSPEEVAAYFENHKHEIPRSHEICVKRYQANEASIRQLDAKYGNLVNMIQGLGVKHKPFLGVEGDGSDRSKGNIETQKVEKWAEDVSTKGAVLNARAEVDGVPGQNDERTSHFERPLREIRVGESPSRPWGISVPPAQLPAESALSSEKEEKAAAEPSEEYKAVDCILEQRHGKEGRNRTAGDQVRDETTEQIGSHSQRICFNGPVFFGYSAEQAAALLQTATFGAGNH